MDKANQKFKVSVRTNPLCSRSLSLFQSEGTSSSHAVAFNQASYTKAYVIMQERQKAN